MDFKQNKGFGEIPEGRKQYLENLRNGIVETFYPDGEPPNVHIKLWRDEETKNVVCADVTSRPEFWDLPNYIEGEDLKSDKFKSLLKSLGDKDNECYVNSDI